MTTEIDYHQPFILPPNRVWRTYQGGRVLDELQGRGSPADSHFPEDWIGSATTAVNPGRDVAGEGVGSARTIDGATYSMSQIYETSPEDALGAEHVEAFGVQPQLLVKLLDSGIRLHIQAHPNVRWAQQHLNADSGKTEAWWILKTRSEDAYVYLGFQHSPTVGEWRRIVAEQDFDAMLACFEQIRVEAGDVLLVEGGIPHAIGPGITMVEIQEPTDYVVRCEYAHGGVELPESARTMGLGLDRVLDLFDYTQYPAETVKERFGPSPRVLAESDAGSEKALLETPQTDRVEVRRVECREQMKLALDGRYSILIVLDGEGEIEADGVGVPVKRWSRVFLPAAVRDVKVSGRLTMARCLPPRPNG